MAPQLGAPCRAGSILLGSASFDHESTGSCHRASARPDRADACPNTPEPARPSPPSLPNGTLWGPCCRLRRCRPPPSWYGLGPAVVADPGAQRLASSGTMAGRLRPDLHRRRRPRLLQQQSWRRVSLDTAPKVLQETPPRSAAPLHPVLPPTTGSRSPSSQHPSPA